MNAKLNYQSKHKENRLFCTRFIRFLIALAAMTVSTTSAWSQTASIKYLNYVGGSAAFEEASHDATQITSSSTSLNGWYYVEGDVTINNIVDLSGNTTIILCDDAKLTISDAHLILSTNTLNIFAQSSGSHKGKLSIIDNWYGINAASDVTINGGDISVSFPDFG